VLQGQSKPFPRNHKLSKNVSARRNTMKTSFSTLVAILAISSSTLVTAPVSACGGGNKGGGGRGGFGGGYNVGGIGIRVGYSGNQYSNKNNSGHCDTNGGYPGGGYPSGGFPYDQSNGQAYEPFHSWYICQQGDSFYTVSLKEYGTSSVANHIARFNRLQPGAALVPGQRLMLPSVSARGQLTQSRAPAPFVDGGVPNSVGAPTAKLAPNAVPAAPVANVTTPSEPVLPKVAIGSTLVLDGQEFGSEAGVARLRVSGLFLPIEVLEWSSSSATVRLPNVESSGALKAEIEVLRADGSLASKTGIELSPAAETLALRN
jgi:hypothetical protein